MCKCSEERQTCGVCGEGFLERVTSGKEPFFKIVKIPLKRVPVCGCKEEKGQCDTRLP